MLSLTSRTSASPPDLVCCSHLRWNWVFQRPQHLLTRAARDRRVFFFEEPIFADGSPRFDLAHPAPNIVVATPVVPHGTAERDVIVVQRTLLDSLLAQHDVKTFTLWYYTPMALPFTEHLHPVNVVYDCMDELSAFAGAPPALRALERTLLERCDVVFTGGYSLFEAKRDLHPQVYAMPSSVDAEHFGQARRSAGDPTDQAAIRRPRLGFCGVIDERLDLRLVAGVAAARPEWQCVLIGPVTKIDPASLPRATNIHYLGPKGYAELPAYLGGWDVGVLPFAHNESTRFISPTKTPEYLAAGLPVVSTSITDVVRSYGSCGHAWIADDVPDFVAAIDAALSDERSQRLRNVDELLARSSWDRTWALMESLLSRATARAA
jgi:glycosyltransferase involved in cell wall biosynthesis